MKKVLLLFLIIFSIQNLKSQGITITILTTDESCVPGNDGTITTSIGGGMPPFTYFWSPGAMLTPSLFNLSAGNYAVTVTDANGRTQTAVATVNSANAANLSSQVVPPSCDNSNDGSISVTAIGGTPPYSYSWSNSMITSAISGLNAGIYTVTVTDLSLCTATSTFTLAAPPPIIKTITQSGLILTSNQNNAAYQWLDYTQTGVISPINGATSQSYTAPLNGFFAVEISLNGCIDTSMVISTFTIGLNEDVNISNRFKIFPNPSQGKFFIEGQGLKGRTLRIYDLSGKVILEEYSSTNSLQKDLSHLDKGIYFLDIEGKRSKIVLTD